MSKKTRNILIIVILVIIGLILAVMLGDWGITETPPAAVNQQPGDQSLVNQNQQTSLPASLATAQPLELLSPAELSLYNTARNFAERYGSFSTDSKFANLEEVKLFSSAKMINELNEIISKTVMAAEFYGVTSKVLNIEIEEVNDNQGTGQAAVSLQRQETKGNNQPRVFYQQLELKLIKSGSSWLVDEASWL